MVGFDSRPSADKDFCCASDQDDPQTLFDEFLNHDSVYHVVDCADSHRLESFEFNLNFDEDTTTSESYSADSTISSNRPPEQSSPVSKIATPPRRSSALRPHRALPNSDRLNPSISSIELLRIEGKGRFAPREPTPPASSGVQVLRRKGRFCSSREASGYQACTVLRTSTDNTMQPSYSYHEEAPINQEWTQRFEQISLQQPEPFREDLSSPSIELAQQQHKSPVKRPPYIQSPLPGGRHRKTVSEQVASRQRFNGSQTINDTNLPNENGFQLFDHGMPSQRNLMSNHVFHSSDSNSESITPSRHARQPASWSQSPADLVRQDYATSANQIHSDWGIALQQQNENSFDNATARMTFQDYSLPEFPPDYDAYTQLNDYSNTSNGYHMENMPHRDISSPPNHYELPNTIQSHDTIPFPQRLPNPPALPPQYSTSPPQEEPTSSHRRPSKRRSRPHSLRLPKSVGNLKTPKPTSSSDLRSPGSASALRSSKSASGLKSPVKSPAGSGAGGGFGFVNFTPSDKGKILTGVAPSGSSKTKARRELEAQEKKRRLSLAAEKLVREAGGDVEKVRRELL